MRLDIGRAAPVGLTYRQEIRWIGGGLAVSFVYSMGYLLRLYGAYQQLFTQVGRKKVLIEGAVMEGFPEILGGGLVGFFIVAGCMVALAAYHVAYHYQGGRSIYLMRRLPRPTELIRRCLTLPAAAAAVSLLAAALLLLLYFGLYRLVTPAGCLGPGARL